MGTFYDDLGVKSSATAEEIETAYRWLAQKFHPDRNLGRESEASAHFVRIQKAYEVLSDPAARAKYNESLAVGKSTATGSPRRDKPPKSKRRTSATIPYFIAAGLVLLVVVAAILNSRTHKHVTLGNETESKPVAPLHKDPAPSTPKPKINVTKPPLVSGKDREPGHVNVAQNPTIPEPPTEKSPTRTAPQATFKTKAPGDPMNEPAAPPKPAPEAKPSTPPTPITIEFELPELPKRPNVPDDQSQQAARKRISSTYSTGVAKSLAEKSTLAQRLLEDAVAEQDPSVRFMLELMSTELFVEAGNCDGAWSAIDAMEIQFEIDPFAKKNEALSSIVSASKKTPAQVKDWVQRWLELTSLASALERYEDAVGCAEQAAKTARTTPNEVVQRIAKQRLDHMQELKVAFDTAQSILAKSPSDATAAAIWGKFLCTHQNRWHEGLSLWSKGEDNDNLTAIAKRDFACPTNVGDQLLIADQWLEAAGKELDDLSKQSLRGRALHWYEIVQPRITGVDSANVEAKIQKIKSLMSLLPLNELVNLLGMVETESPARNGTWERRADRALTGSGVMEIPVIARGSYELEVMFSWTRPKSPDPSSLIIREFDVAQITFPIGNRAATLSIPEMRLQTGLENLPPTKYEKPTFRANHQPPYKFKIRVDALAKEFIRIDGSVDGKTCLRWEGPMKEPREDYEAAEKELAIRLHTSLKPTTIHSVKLRMLSGTASLPVVPKPNGAQ